MADYYGYYDKQMNNGKVFATDLNLREGVQRDRLTAAEITERTDWCAKIPLIKAHYKGTTRDASSLELMLQERVMVPNLARQAVSTRSKLKEPRDGRRYPETVSPWANFSRHVEGWVAPDLALDDDVDIFKLSMQLTSVKIALSDEEMEKVSGFIYCSLLPKKSSFHLQSSSYLGALAVDLESIIGGDRCIWWDCESRRSWEARRARFAEHRWERLYS
jgi:hypothetical protein